MWDMFRSSLVLDTMSLRQLCPALVLTDLRHMSPRIQRSPPYYKSTSNNKVPTNHICICTLSDTLTQTNFINSRNMTN